MPFMSNDSNIIVYVVEVTLYNDLQQRGLEL